MKLVVMPSDRTINDWVCSHIKKAIEFAIFQHEVDHLKAMYSKYKETNPSEQERFEDIAYCDRLLK